MLSCPGRNISTSTRVYTVLHFSCSDISVICLYIISSIDSYDKRTVGIDSVSVAMMGEMTTLEKKLVESMDVIGIRGKVRNVGLFFIGYLSIKLIPYSHT